MQKLKKKTIVRSNANKFSSLFFISHKKLSFCLNRNMRTSVYSIYTARTMNKGQSIFIVYSVKITYMCGASHLASYAIYMMVTFTVYISKDPVE